MRKCKIISTGAYLPEKIVKSTELDARFGLTPGKVEEKSGVKSRRYCTEHETAPFMGARALEEALAGANLRLDELDLIIGASGTFAQMIPCNAALVKDQIEGARSTSVPCFDVNSTCLSFVTALDVASSLLETNSGIKRIALVSSERISIGLNYNEIESSSLMGDGACAVIVEASKDASQGILASHMETYTEGIRDAEVPAGGTNRSPVFVDDIQKEELCFTMNGPQIYRLASRQFLPFCDILFNKAGIKKSEIDMVIPHQASLLAIRLLQKKMELPDEKVHLTLPEYGNNVSASVPLCLHDAVKKGKVQRGQTLLLVGTSAGLSIGGIILRY